MRTVLPLILEIVGLAVVAACCWLWVSPYLAGIVAGGVCAAAGEQLERRGS